MRALLMRIGRVAGIIGVALIGLANCRTPRRRALAWRSGRYAASGRHGGGPACLPARRRRTCRAAAKL